MTQASYDRTTQDVGNVILMEHVNVTVPSQELALLFYVVGLGFTRDPYLMVGPENMWINVGRQQLHLPTRTAAQVIPGHIGLVVPEMEALRARLAAVKGKLAGTSFAYTDEGDYVAVTCPWGNRFRCHLAGPQFGQMELGIPYVEFLVPAGTAHGIARFYREGLQAPATVTEEEDVTVARVGVGCWQSLIFRETTRELPEYDGHHVAVYLANFSGPHAFLGSHGLITEESNAHQYRFCEIVHPETGKTLHTLEHEVRSLHHPMWGRPLVNRNASQRLGMYGRGRDAFVPPAPG